MPPLLPCRGRACADGCERRRSASMLATTFHYAATRRITEIGLLVAGVGGLVIALGSSRRTWVGLGGLLIAVGLAAAGRLALRRLPLPARPLAHRPRAPSISSLSVVRSTIGGCTPFLLQAQRVSRFGGKATRTPVPCGPCRTRFRGERVGRRTVVLRLSSPGCAVACWENRIGGCTTTDYYGPDCPQSQSQLEIN
jgi:hypothetical protein